MGSTSSLEEQPLHSKRADRMTRGCPGQVQGQCSLGSFGAVSQQPAHRTAQGYSGLPRGQTTRPLPRGQTPRSATGCRHPLNTPLHKTGISLRLIQLSSEYCVRKSKKLHKEDCRNNNATMLGVEEIKIETITLNTGESNSIHTETSSPTCHLTVSSERDTYSDIMSDTLDNSLGECFEDTKHLLPCDKDSKGMPARNPDDNEDSETNKLSKGVLTLQDTGRVNYEKAISSKRHDTVSNFLLDMSSDSQSSSFSDSFSTNSHSPSASSKGQQQHKTPMTGLQRETQNVRLELDKAKESIQLLRNREKQLRDRLSDQAQKLFHMSNTRFEDLSLGDKRPTALIGRYGDLYTEGRVDALDALDSLTELSGLDDLKGKLLFSVIVLAFRSCQHSWEELRSKIRQLLQLPGLTENNNKEGRPMDTTSKEMERHLDQYFCQTIDTFDLSKNIKEVKSQIEATLFDYPSLVNCEGLNKYIIDSVQLAWALVVQNPQYVLNYDAKAFHPHYHTRFAMSDPENSEIIGFLWPALLEGGDGPCVQKGVVIT